ncbi:mechanosensitive ion channel family protein [Myroides injenensis]|uniref:mechanosensitive ion channel family protein n=1 Tax=Myroides injenensis TaxID=1183151 RepID=UPI001ED8DFE9|nr:mechanosensitive ion channel domain-containing protein [Myroides injenensis]
MHKIILQITILLTTFVFLTTASFAQKKNKKNTTPPLEVIEKIDTISIKPLKLEKTPVLILGDTLFYVYGNIGSFTPKQRAKSIEDKITTLAKDYSFSKDSIRLSKAGNYLNIIYKHQILMSVDTIQALEENKTKKQAAIYYMNKIVDSVEQQLYQKSWQQIALQVLGSLVVVVAEILIIRFFYYLYRRVKVMIWKQRSKKIKGLFGLFDDQKAMLIAIHMARIIRFIIILLFIYFGLLIIFTLFPYTKHISDELMGYVIRPLKSAGVSIKDYMPKLFTIIVIVFMFRYIQKFIRYLADRIATNKITIKGFYPDWAFPTYNIISGLLFIFMFIIIFPYLPNSDSQIFQGVSVFAGIMLSLGSTSVIGNLVAGLVITYMRPFKIGDRIKLGEYTGDVLEKTALVTRLKTPKNEVITIPNSNIMSAYTVNYSQSAKDYGLILFITVGVGYDIPWQKVHELLFEVANRTDHILKRQKPFILQDQLQDFYVDYQLNVYVKDAKIAARVYSDLRQNTQDVFAENNIELVSPHYNVNRNVDNTDSTIPYSYIKKTP